MKVCFLGLGSIGQRHLRNLYTIAGQKNINLNIHAFRRGLKPLNKELENIIEKTIYAEEELENDYDIAFITNPTNMHYETIKLMADKSKNMFIEKPLVDQKDYDFGGLILPETGVYYVAGPLRFSEVIQNIKSIIKNEKIYSIRSICSSYLPDWRSNTDYRTVYSAHKDQGGGVCIDLIHEWDYITYLFGFPEEVQCIYGKYSDLEIDSEDIAVYIAKFKDKLVEIHLDYFGRTPKRQLEIFTQRGTITGDLINQTISCTFESEPQVFNNNRNEIHIKELSFFVDNILQRSNFNNVLHSRKVLELAKGRVME